MSCAHSTTEIRDVRGVKYCAGCLRPPEVAERLIAVLLGLVRL